MHHPGLWFSKIGSAIRRNKGANGAKILDTGNVTSMRGLESAVRSSCEHLLATLFGETVADGLINFKDPPVTVRGVKKLLECYDPRAPATFRGAFASLIGTHDVNAPFPDGVCKWLNGNREIVPTADQRFAFSSKVSTLFSFSVWTGDIFCVQLALMAGGNVSWDGTDPPFGIAKPVRRCLEESAELWRPFAARGLEVAGQSEAFLGKGGFADVFRSTFRNQSCAAKRFRTGLKSLPIDDVDSLMTEIVLMCRVRPCKHIVKCTGFFLWDVQFPNMKPCVFLELMDVGLDKVLGGRPHVGAGAGHQRADGGFDYRAHVVSLDNRLNVLRQLAAAVQYLHRSSPPIVHRDIKPANVLLKAAPIGGDAPDSVKVIAKLSDFGISNVGQKMFETMTSTQRVNARLAGQGTMMYMSPAQWNSAEKQTTKSDMFSLGLTMVAVVCMTYSPWFECSKYERYVPQLCGRTTPWTQEMHDDLFDDTKQMESRVNGSEWPWKQWGRISVPDVPEAVLVPPLVHGLIAATVTSRPTTRIDISMFRECWSQQINPLEKLKQVQQSLRLPSTGAEWSPLSSADFRKAVPPYFDSPLDTGFDLPAFLSAIRVTHGAPSMEAAMITMSSAPASGISPADAAIALQACRRRLKKIHDKYAGDDTHVVNTMTDDALLSIIMYTFECRHNGAQVRCYGPMNAALRSGKPGKVWPFVPYIKMLLEAVRTFAKLCPANCVQNPLLHRGISGDVKFEQDTMYVAWDFWSTSKQGDVARSFAFRNASGTYLQLVDTCGVDITMLSYFGDCEKEVLVLPGASFRVLNFFELSGRNFVTAAHVLEYQDRDDVLDAQVSVKPGNNVFSVEVEWQPNDIQCKAENVEVDSRSVSVTRMVDSAFAQFDYPVSASDCQLGRLRIDCRSDAELPSKAGRSTTDDDAGGSTKGGHAPWIYSDILAVVPGETIYVSMNVKTRSTSNKVRALCSHATPFCVPNYIPSTVTNISVSLAHTWEDPLMQVEGYLPHTGGGAVITSVELQATDSETRQVLEGEVALTTKGRHIFSPPTIWEGKKCCFMVRCVIECGSNVRGYEFPTNIDFYIPAKWQFAPVREAEALERLKRRLKGSNLLDRTGSRYLNTLGLCVDHMPFGPESLTIREWLLRGRHVKSIAKSLGACQHEKLPSNYELTVCDHSCRSARNRSNDDARA